MPDVDRERKVDHERFDRTRQVVRAGDLFQLGSQLVAIRLGIKFHVRQHLDDQDGLLFARLSDADQR